MAFKIKEDLPAQLLHYDVSVGAYMQMDEPRPLVQEALALLIPRPMAEEVGGLRHTSALQMVYSCFHSTTQQRFSTMAPLLHLA